MKKIKFLLLISALLAGSAACNLEETNIDPTRQADVALNLMLPDALSQAAYNQMANPARIPGIIMQQFIGFDAQQVAYTDYVIGEDVYNNYWRTGLYQGVLKSCDVIIQKAQEEDNSYYEGIAKIIMAESYGMATLFFGDVPQSEALQGNENLQPAYDSQSDVLIKVQSLLDEGIQLLGNPGGANPGSADLYFGGDADAWIKTAHALKARYLMQTIKRDEGNAAKVLNEIDAAFKSLDEQPTFQFESGQNSNNPLDKFGIERPNTMIIDTRFAERMINREDPRLDYYAFLDGEDWKYHDGSNPKLVWAQGDSPAPLISYVELKFLEAEALHRTNAGTEEVQDALEAAITASMEQIGVAEDYSAYVAAQSDLSGLSGGDVLKRIIEEAYFAYYGYAFQQVWHNYRRTGYPELTPSPNGANGLNPSGVIPRRFIYPESEASLNSANLDAAKQRQGGALLDAELWVFE